jgi:hypothetical protein
MDIKYLKKYLKYKSKYTTSGGAKPTNVTLDEAKKIEDAFGSAWQFHVGQFSTQKSAETTVEVYIAKNQSSAQQQAEQQQTVQQPVRSSLRLASQGQGAEQIFRAVGTPENGYSINYDEWSSKLLYSSEDAEKIVEYLNHNNVPLEFIQSLVSSDAYFKKIIERKDDSVVPIVEIPK